MTTYTPLQAKWLRFHFEKWRTEYGWSPKTFAQKTKQPPEALAEALGVPLEEFKPPAPPVPAPLPASPAALPTPGSATHILAPGVELMPREASPAPPPPKPAPSPTVGYVLLTTGLHNIDGRQVDIPGPRGDSVWHALPFGRHVIDDVVQHVFKPAGGIPIDLSSIRSEQ